jgi:endonuclease/exonuclease/phosphatase family metal-dependent hydrolase
MSLLSPAARRLATVTQALSKPLSRVGPQAQQSAQAPAQARRLDTFTPSAPAQGPSPRRPEINPQAVRGYGEPQQATDLPDPTGTGVLTLNTANGVSSGEFRDPEDRARQAKFIQQTGASIVALQEVDVGVDRTGNINTALDVIRRAYPDFDAFLTANEATIRKGSDGTTQYQTPAGTLVTGEAFSGDDRPRGINDDTGRNASYGNAIFVAPPHQVSEAYTVALPSSLNADAPQAASQEQLAALADGKLTDAERQQLGQTNEAIRDDPNGDEPRGALVTRVVGPDGREKTIINIHTAAGSDNAELRQRQLEYVAQIVEAESKGPPAREVVVLGDFNDSTANVGNAFEDTGLERTVGGSAATGANFDQIWTSGGITTQNSAQVATNGAISDHENAGYTEIV